MSRRNPSWQRVADEAERLFGARPGDQALGRLEAHAALVREWSARVNLVSFRTEEELLVRHFLDSLAPLRLLPQGRLVLADVGSGAGLPGIPLAVVRPELTVVLIESRRRRASFLRHVVRSLGLGNAEVAEGRSEELESRWGGRFDAVVGRAVRPDVVTDFAAATLRERGCAVLMGKASAQVAVPSGFAADGELRYELPGGDVHVVRRLKAA